MTRFRGLPYAIAAAAIVIFSVARPAAIASPSIAPDRPGATVPTRTPTPAARLYLPLIYRLPAAPSWPAAAIPSRTPPPWAGALK